MTKKIIVIGASAASIAFITKVRSFDKDSNITCFSGEKEIPYNRCFLADFVTGEKDQQAVQLKPDDFFEQKQIDLQLNSWVTKIDTKNNQIFVDDISYDYDYLFIGTGSKPSIPPIEGDLKAEGIFQFHTLDDAKKLSEYIKDKKPMQAVVIGAGLNGIEAASSLHERGVAVGLIDCFDRLLARQVDDKVGDYIKKEVQSKGTALFMGHYVQKINVENGKVKSVQLSTGATIFVECVILTTGVTVDSSLFTGTSIALQDGSILVNDAMQTSLLNVYAGGDVCIVKDCVTGELVKSATWPDAMLQGLTAGTQLSEKPRCYPGAIGMRDSEFFEKQFYACGNTICHDDSYEKRYYQGEHSCEVLYIQNNKLKGFVLFGDVSKVGEYKRLYITQQNVDD